MLVKLSGLSLNVTGELAEHHWECHHQRKKIMAYDILYEISKQIQMG